MMTSRRKVVLGIGMLVAASVFTGCTVDSKPTPQSQQSELESRPSNRSLRQIPDRAQTLIYIADNQLTVEVVSTPQSVTQGLSGRSEIGADGMLFVFPNRQERFFWMKDMQFAIDIVWLDQGTVVGIEEAVPYPSPSTLDQDLARYQSGQPVSEVLELPAGRAEELGIEVGSKLSLVQE